ncbi:MAG TPA: M13 family peptidase, partial [Thermoanaerobaculia bacterium]
MRTIRLALAAALITTAAMSADNKASVALDKTDLDTTANACTDFNQYANGGWLKKNPIPPAYSNWGVANVLQEHNREMLRSILD